ncbi:hypothetical protein [Luteipulveratus halotolerans]|uniref:Nudix hydrolase domain-containing protein n=1 Tax=Luteipulveratus halotolerans TaxID=1631356 RepID=A0A0L6CL41_9MICO|nr:hypothetical protein [Luteipulveratus halotolerans]KNX38253.1 hypothetical protein VV01_15635 [Luteipulveratus halotolerans]
MTSFEPTAEALSRAALRAADLTARHRVGAGVATHVLRACVLVRDRANRILVLPPSGDAAAHGWTLPERAVPVSEDPRATAAELAADLGVAERPDLIGTHSVWSGSAPAQLRLLYALHPALATSAGYAADAMWWTPGDMARLTLTPWTAGALILGWEK